MSVQNLRDLCQTVGRCLDLEVAGHRTADFLRVYDGRILLNDALLLQCLDPCLHGDSGYADFLPDVRVGNARIFYEQLYDFLIQCVQPVQIHSVPSVCKLSMRIIAPFFPKVNMPLTRRLCRAIIVAIRNYQLSFCEDSL